MPATFTLDELAKQADLLALQGLIGSSVQAPEHVNTLLTSDVMSLEWRSVYTGQKPNIHPFAANFADSKPHAININQDAPSNALLAAKFRTPAGCTSIQCSAMLAKWGSNVNVSLVLVTNGGATVQSQAFSLTSQTPSLKSFTATVTADTEYNLCLAMNGNYGSDAQGQFICTGAWAKPVNGTSDIWDADTQYIPATPDVLHYTDFHIGMKASGRVWSQLAASEMQFYTNAELMIIEGVNTASYTYEIGVTVNDSALGTLSMTSGDNQIRQKEYALPAGMKKVTIHSGNVAGNSNGENGVTGAYIRGVILPKSAEIFLVRPDNAQPKLVVDADSIASSTGGPYRLWPQMLRNQIKSPVYITGWGGNRMLESGVGATSTDRVNRAQRIARLNPSIIWIALGTNDYGAGSTAANFQTAYADYVDRLHEYMPQAKIYCQTPTVRTTETANAGGSTLGDFRTAIVSVCSTRTFANDVDGTAILTTGDLSDGLHPNVNDTIKITRFVAKTILGVSSY